MKNKLIDLIILINKTFNKKCKNLLYIFKSFNNNRGLDLYTCDKKLIEFISKRRCLEKKNRIYKRTINKIKLYTLK